MIHYVYGDILNSNCEVLTCPVNCVGVMGKGLALQFKNKYPDMFESYKLVCARGMYYPGMVWLHPHDFSNPSFPVIACLATKDHWINPSKMEWVADGIRTLANIMKGGNSKVAGKSIAIPALGCGCGGLEWTDVQILIHKHFCDYDGEVEVYMPPDAPQLKDLNQEKKHGSEIHQET